MASFMGMAERGNTGGYGREFKEQGGELAGMGGEGVAQPMGEAAKSAETMPASGGYSTGSINPWMKRGGNMGISGGLEGSLGGYSRMPPTGGVNNQAMPGGMPEGNTGGYSRMPNSNPYGQYGNPWTASGQIDHTKFTPEWAKPKQLPPELPPVQPTEPAKGFKDVAGFSDFDPGVTGTLAQGQDFITREAKARGADTSGWTPDFMNGIANKIGFNPASGNLTGAQFNQARRLLFGG